MMSRIEELTKQIEEIDKQRIELQQELELEKQKNEIVYPFEKGDDYYFVGRDGSISDWVWNGVEFEKQYYKLGNAFKTKEEAVKERDKRILLTRFRQFRDKCNGDWKPESDEVKYYIFLECINLKFDVSYHTICNAFNLFGYFKHKGDAKRAIGLFGDEIKCLYVEE